MSWAAHRVTTKVEDMAHCLLGLFDVNMPLLYVQSQDKAFQQLQEEILRSSDDESLFTWQPDPTSRPSGPAHEVRALKLDQGLSILAQHPRHFLGTAYLPRFASGGEASMAGGIGLNIELPVFKIDLVVSGPFRIAVLNWFRRSKHATEPCVGIVVQKLCLGVFIRCLLAPLVRLSRGIIWSWDLRTITVRKTTANSQPVPLS